MADVFGKKTGADSSEKITQERMYALLYRLNEEVKSLSAQIRAMRNLIEENENR